VRFRGLGLLEDADRDPAAGADHDAVLAGPRPDIGAGLPPGHRPRGAAGGSAGRRAGARWPGPGQSAEQVEPSPTDSSSDDQIVEFIGRRFDPAVLPQPWVRDDRSLLRDGAYWHRPTRFWVAIRARARDLLGSEADPSRNYVMPEVVHCKSRHEIGVAAAARTCAQRYLDDIVRLSAAPLIAVVGKAADATLTAWLSWLPEPPYITSAELGGRPRTLVYVSHPSSWGEPKTITAWTSWQTSARLPSGRPGDPTLSAHRPLRRLVSRLAGRELRDHLDRPDGPQAVVTLEGDRPETEGNIQGQRGAEPGSAERSVRELPPGERGEARKTSHVNRLGNAGPPLEPA
jgi:hypothetical protein